MANNQRTETWPLHGGNYALYIENANIEEPAQAAGLRLMGTYTKNGAVLAKQFTGIKNAVISLVERKYPFKAFR